MHSLQPCQLGKDSLLNMVLYLLLDMRGRASLCKPLEIPGGFLGSAGNRCLRSGHNRSDLRSHRKFPLSSGGASVQITCAEYELHSVKHEQSNRSDYRCNEHDNTLICSKYSTHLLASCSLNRAELQQSWAASLSRPNHSRIVQNDRKATPIFT